MPKSTQTENRYSVCIGINNYAPSADLGALRYAEADARAMDELLGQRGFPNNHRKLFLGKDATLDAINAALGEIIRNRARENDLVIFYFAGHSKPIRSDDDDEIEVFLASYDFDSEKIRKDAYFREETALGMGRLRSRFFERGRSRQRLFIFDSCYSGDFFGSPYRDATTVQEHIENVFKTNSPGRIALSSCLPIQKALEQAKYGHGLFTYHLLKALSGEDSTALRSDGCLTANGLFEYVTDKLKEEGSQRPVFSGVQHDIFELICYPHLATPVEDGQAGKETRQDMRRTERIERLRALLADHRGFLHDRLESFVGREAELAEIQGHITETIPTGGYVTITGQAGQGKSSIIAKLVEEYGEEQVTYHFIPFNPGPDHQVGLLRNLMARLILKYDLSDFYVSSESRPALKEFFPKVLEEVVTKGAQELIFLDGLDQLEVDFNDVRDLSFLPTNPPAGVVFVLGTRPNDTLEPLELLKPLVEYRLPSLSRLDFDRLLLHRGVSLERNIADQLYQVLQENALYLDLVAKELQEQRAIPVQEMITRLAHDPANIFSLSMARLKRPAFEWREVIKPVLGALLVAQEPLSFSHLRQILHLEADRLRDALKHLGGLVADTGQQHYILFHLKLRDYLKQDEKYPEKEYIFAIDEEERWHEIVATWCEKGNFLIIWQKAKDLVEQERREYARRHYVAHLYYSQQWEQLFALLDEGSYGHAKELYDLSTRSYIQDLDLGRRATVWSGWTLEEGMALLPHLWRYTLLRCSLRSRADRYPLITFQLLLQLGREQEVLGIAELLTEPQKKAQVFQLIAEYLVQMPTQQSESMQFILRAYEVTLSIENSYQRTSALCELAAALTNAKEWEQAEAVARSIPEGYQRTHALCELAAALTNAKEWEQAEAVARSIPEEYERTHTLIELAGALVKTKQRERAEPIWTEAEMVARSVEEESSRARALIRLAATLTKAEQWERAEPIWTAAETVTNSIQKFEESENRITPAPIVTAGEELAEALILARQWERAEAVARSIGEVSTMDHPMSKLARALGEAEQWERAEAIAYSIAESERADAFVKLVEALSVKNRNELLLNIVQRAWLITETSQIALHLLPLAFNFISFEPKIGSGFYEAFKWVDNFLSG